MSTKILLKVKSGPGDIVGEVERDLIGDQVSFDGLQFTEPGNYVISVIPSNIEFEQTEFEISVEPEEEVIPQETSEDEVKEEKRNVQGDRPIIAQIDQPKIKLNPIELDVYTDEKMASETLKSIGYMPFMYYYGDQIPERDISMMKLYYDGMIPSIIISFTDSKDIVRSNPPLDDSKFELFLSSGSSNLKSIHLRFKIKNHKERKNGKYTFTGILDIEDLYKVNFRSYDGGSFEVLREIAKELNLGYNSNINSTNDEMKWVNTGKIYKSFIREIIQHSYISDSSFMLGYVDFYWCLNYVDLEKEWNRDISNDVGIVTRTVVDMDNSEKISRLKLSNEPSLNNTNLYFIDYKFLNNSTKKSLNEGHYTIIKYYDENSKTFLEFNVDSLSSNKDDVISLKGAPNDEKNYNELFVTEFLGKYDTDNVHKEYKYAEIQNKRNLNSINKVVAELYLPNPNFNLYKFQKIDVHFFNSVQTIQNDTYTNERISGEWLIIDIRYEWKRGSLKQVLTISRKELNKKKEELDSTTRPRENNNDNNNEINENPMDSTEAPNSIYQVGDTYNIKGEDGKLYNIIVEKVSENGTDIVAKIKEL
jgi:hypothetical protein